MYPIDGKLTLDALALSAKNAISKVEFMLDDDPDNRDARSLLYDSETVTKWLKTVKAF